MAINPITGEFVPDLLNAPIVQGGPTFGAGSAGFQAIDPLTGAPPTGLIGSEQALTSAADNALLALRNARNIGVRDLQAAGAAGVGELRGGRDVGTQFLGQAIGGFDPFATQGTQAGDVQAALSGALGPQAQQAALANLQPVNAFLEEQGRRQVTRSAAALGGLGGGNVRRELVRFGQGLAGQSAQQQFANLGTVAERGFGALGQQGAFRGQQADIATQAGRDIASNLLRTGEGVLGARQTAAQDIASVFGGTGTQLAAGRTGAGQGIAQAIGGTTSALSDLISQQGQQAGAVVGTAQSNLANLLASAGQQQGASQQQLAALLANLATQQGSQVAGLPGIPGVQQTPSILGQIGQAAGGIGTAVTAFSDIRLKDNIVKVGQTAEGNNLYTWDWNDEGLRLAKDQPTFGVIAQDIMLTQPDSITIGPDGFMMVDYGSIH